MATAHYDRPDVSSRAAGWVFPLWEAFSFYEAIVRKEDLDLPSRPYRDYIEWLERKYLSARKPFGEKLNGFAAPTPLVVDQRPLLARIGITPSDSSCFYGRNHPGSAIARP
jgi:hypothetical protein